MSDSQDFPRSPGKDDLPSAFKLSSLDPEFREQPHPILDRLRAEGSVHRDKQFSQRLFVIGYEDGRELLADRSLWVDPRKAREGVPSRIMLGIDRTDKPYEPSLIALDDPDHKRLRSLVSQAFNQRSVDAFRPRIRAIAEQLLDAVARGSGFDVIGGYAGPLPIIVIAEMMGVDPADQANFKRWSEAQIHMFNPLRTPEQEAEHAWGQASLEAYFKTAIDARRARRGSDLISGMVAAEEDGERLSEREIVLTCSLLLFAGNVTTTDLIGNGVLALLRHPDQLTRLQAHPELAQIMVEEVLRYDPPVMQAARFASTTLEIDGTTIEAGEQMNVSLLAVAHDPASNPDPHRFDIERANPRHLSFGGGAHFCLGAPLARAEAEIAIPLLFERFPTLRLDPDHVVRRKATPPFLGVEALWVRS